MCEVKPGAGDPHSRGGGAGVGGGQGEPQDHGGEVMDTETLSLGLDLNNGIQSYWSIKASKNLKPGLA